MFFSILHRYSSSASFIIIAFFFCLFLSLDLFSLSFVKFTLMEVPVLQGFNVNIWWQTAMLTRSQTCNIGLHYIY